MTVYNPDAGKTFLTGWLDPESDPISIRGLGLTSGTVATVDWVANGGTAVFTIGSYQIEVKQDGSVAYNNLGSITNQPQAGASATIGDIYYTVWDGVLTGPVTKATLTMTASVVPSVTPPLFSIDENLAQGVDLFTFAYLNATAPGAITLSNIVPAGALQMKADGITLQSGPTPVNYEAPTFQVTYDASFSDATGGPYVTHCAMPVNDLPEGGATFAFGDLDVVRSVVTTINPPASLTAGSGSYSATNLPRGLACDPITGIITGKPFWYLPRQTVTLTRGVGNATALMGVTCKTGITPPNSFLFNFDPAWWTTPTFTASASTSAALTTAIKAALDQSGGTTDAPVVTIIDYTGPDITAPYLNFDASAASANQSTAFAVVRGGGKLMRQLNWGYKQGVIRWESWIIPGDINAASNQYVQRDGNSIHNYYACDFGPFYSGEGFTLLSANVPPFKCKPGMGFVAEKCRMGGWTVGPAFSIDGNNTCYLIDVFSTYNGNDFWAGYHAGFISSWMVACTGWGKRSTNAGLHPDAAQTGAQSGAAVEYVTFEDTAIFAPDPRYGSSGLRIQWEGGTPTTHARTKNCIFGISGWEGFIMRGEDWEIDGLMIVPSPGVPAYGCQITLNASPTYPGRAKMANTWADVINKRNGWATTPPAISGQAKTFNVSNAASMVAAFPNITGALRATTRLNGTTYVTRTSYDIDEPVGVALHPDAVRAYTSNILRPDIGWGPWLKNPTSYGIYDWGAVPTVVAPVLTSVGVSGANLNFTTDASNGYYFWMVDQETVVPSYACMIVGVQHDGKFGAAPGQTVASYDYGISSSAGAKSVAMTGLTAGQSYKARMFMLNRVTGALSPINTVTFTA